MNLKTFPFPARMVKLLPESAARRYKALVLEDKGDTLLVAVGDPLDLFAYDELSRILKRHLSIAAVAESSLPAGALDRLYRRTEEISGLARALEKDLSEAVDFGELSATVGQKVRPWCACCNRYLRMPHRSARPMSTSNRKKQGCKCVCAWMAC